MLQKLQIYENYVFSVFLKFRAYYITGHWGGFTVKNATLKLHKLSWHLFFIFFIKKFVFLSFNFFFLVKYPIFSRILTNQKPE